MIKQPEALNALYSAIISLKTEEDCKKFLEDLCTISELHSLAQRWSVAKLLHEGKTFNEIMTEVGASSATISRVNRCLLYGSGGYKDMIENQSAETSVE